MSESGALIATVEHTGSGWNVVGTVNGEARTFMRGLASRTEATTMAGELQAGAAAYDARTWEDAFKHLLPVACAGSADARAMIASLYHLGLGVPPDASEALRWYALAAEQGDAGSAWHLGTMLAGEEGRAWRKRAIELGFFEGSR